MMALVHDVLREAEHSLHATPISKELAAWLRPILAQRSAAEAHVALHDLLAWVTELCEAAQRSAKQGVR